MNKNPEIWALDQIAKESEINIKRYIWTYEQIPDCSLRTEEQTVLELGSGKQRAEIKRNKKKKSEGDRGGKEEILGKGEMKQVVNLSCLGREELWMQGRERKQKRGK